MPPLQRPHESLRKESSPGGRGRRPSPSALPGVKGASRGTPPAGPGPLSPPAPRPGPRAAAGRGRSGSGNAPPLPGPGRRGQGEGGPGHGRLPRAPGRYRGAASRCRAPRQSRGTAREVRPGPAPRAQLGGRGEGGAAGMEGPGPAGAAAGPAQSRPRQKLVPNGLRPWLQPRVSLCVCLSALGVTFPSLRGWLAIFPVFTTGRCYSIQKKKKKSLCNFHTGFLDYSAEKAICLGFCLVFVL